MVHAVLRSSLGEFNLAAGHAEQEGFALSTEASGIVSRSPGGGNDQTLLLTRRFSVEIRARLSTKGIPSMMYLFGHLVRKCPEP